MAEKRQATYELNHDNWDREEEPEDPGTFRTATEDELKNRIIKKAKRKISPAVENETVDGSSGAQSVFSGFSGFGKPAATTTSSSPFSFLSKIPAVAAPTSIIVSSSTSTTSSAPKHAFGISSTAIPATATSSESSKQSFSFSNTVCNMSTSTAKNSSAANTEISVLSEYHMKLSCLNKAVCEWIKVHVDKSPICILSPIFEDYKKYLEEIESETKNLETKDAMEKPSSDSKIETFILPGSCAKNTGPTNKLGTSEITTGEVTAKTNGFNYGLKKLDEISKENNSTTSSFTFGINSTTLPITTTSLTSNNFSFGNVTNNTNQSTAMQKPFSFNPGGTPFSFGNVKPPDAIGTTTTDDPTDDDEEPPKNDFKQVVEADTVYSKKCKVFVKKDGNFVDKGVGTLYLKPVESSNKTQLLVRADTNLGNILVNLILNSSIPTQRMGKNNVMLVCLPTPDVGKPTSMLLRVKTGEEADELLENINKYKK